MHIQQDAFVGGGGVVHKLCNIALCIGPGALERNYRAALSCQSFEALNLQMRERYFTLFLFVRQRQESLFLLEIEYVDALLLF